MGLDMYLYIREHEYISKQYRSKGTKLKLKYPKEILEFFDNFRDERYSDKKVWDDRSISRSTDYMIGYWRKANHIHNWFVQNCGDGVDECQDIYVSFNKLEDLYNTCLQVTKDHSKADKLLPTCSGFLFGGTEYDEYYFDNIEKTMEILEKTLKVLKKQQDKKNNKKDFCVIYQASW